MIKVEEKLIFFVFVTILILVLSEGLFCQPEIGPLVLKQIFSFLPFEFCKQNFFNTFWRENGFIENLQSIFLLLAIILLFKFKKEIKDENRFINFFIILKIIALIYYLGEEISWGQHFLNWQTPEFFKIYNNQKETNIHNISNIFDQFPRTLVLLWCGLSVPLILFLKNFIRIEYRKFLLVCPNIKLLNVSLILLFFVLPDLVIDKLNLHPGASDKILTFLNSSYFYDLISFNFIRLSELHELIFSFYFFFYAYLINNSSKKNL
tara:strand:+ start:247 stop:1038 length:792 start_codon:yes stop_codon:yes gene_type:complete